MKAPFAVLHAVNAPDGVLLRLDLSPGGSAGAAHRVVVEPVGLDLVGRKRGLPIGLHGGRLRRGGPD